ncbi:MAG: DUF1194 domain-containing protein [Rhizobiales bacterium]|nr:DUF1194 domain-containing protein [Hyphomicrobiales bacterium]
MWVRRAFLGRFLANGMAAALFAAGLTKRAAAQKSVDLLLLPAVDTSGSVNEERFVLQRNGYAAAFRDAQVLSAIRQGGEGAVAVAMVQWTGPRLQQVAVPWTRIADRASADAFAAAIDAAPRVLFGGGTSISGAIDYGAAMLGDAPFTAARKVIDVSGDGMNNRGRPAPFARDEAVAAGIVINGLPILGVEPGLDTYYEQSVIGGTGAFMVVAENYEQFGQAVRRKLIQEIAGGAPPGRSAGAGIRRL